MSTAILLIPALILDATLGEPNWLWSRLPHPAVLMGKLVAWLDQRLNYGAHRKIKGCIAAAVLLFVGVFLGQLLAQLGAVVTVVITAILIAQRSLVEHVAAVAHGLSHSLDKGRAAVAMIVSRDTINMTEAQVSRSAIESGAENFSDAVIAPAFWFLVAGLPGLIAYKLINTGDSMIGYRSPKYRDFGWATARLDDLVNLIPARLSAILIAAVANCLTDMAAITRDARLHRSPNAGWPEAAMARAIHVSLAGPRSYEGVLQDFPWVHKNGNRTPTAFDIHHSTQVLWKTWVLSLVLLVALTVLFSIM